MTHRPELEGVIEAMRSKRLQPRDLATFMALMANMNWRTGRVRVTTTALAEQMGVPISNVSTSVSRLSKESLVHRMKDESTGEVFFMLNPTVVSVGSQQRKGFLVQRFSEALSDSAGTIESSAAA